MKILIVCSDHSGKISPFITEQANSLELLGVEINYFLVDKKGFFGYLKKRKDLMNSLNDYKPDIIHAHYGLSGLLANLQRKVPVITTYHGSDINDPTVFPFSRICMMLSVYNIFVSEKIRLKSRLNGKQIRISCGVDIQLFKPTDKVQARKKLNLDQSTRYVLFSGSFQNSVKNAELAQRAVSLLTNVELLELKGYPREQVAALMNAVDVVLMTSFSEGSPQFVKEAMACNCPIVSVPVGDVPEIIKNMEGCSISTYEPGDIVGKLKQAIESGKRTNGRQRIIDLKLDTESIAKRILKIYNEVEEVRRSR